MAETVGVVILIVAHVLALPAFVYLLARVLWRQPTERPTVTLLRRHPQAPERQHQTKH